VIIDIDASPEEQPAARECSLVHEHESELLDAIRQEAEDLSAECHVSEDRSSKAVTSEFEPLRRNPLCESEYELLDVDPELIDQYMNRLLARTQRAESIDRKGADPRRLSMPAFPADPKPTADTGVPETETATEESTRPLTAVAESPEKTTVLPARRPASKQPSPRGAIETRANRDNLREIVVQSTRSFLVHQIRRRHQVVLFRKVLLIFLALGLATSLYSAHFLYGVPIRHLAWGATAIGMVALLGMAQIWSQTARRQARLHVRISYARRRS
jgi:hypothetical protein